MSAFIYQEVQWKVYRMKDVVRSPTYLTAPPPRIWNEGGFESNHVATDLLSNPPAEF